MAFKNYSNYKAPEDIKRLKFISDTVEELLKPGAAVLDVGCGNGNITMQMGYMGYNALGIDLSVESIEKANALNTLPNVDFKVLAAEEVDPALKFDCIICSEVMEHLTAPELVLKTMVGMVKDDGILIITVPNGWGPRELFVTRPMQAILLSDNIFRSLVIAIKRGLGYKGYTPQSSSGDLTHLQFFTKSDLKGMFKRTGLKMVKFGHINFIEKVFPFSLIFRYSTKLQWFDCAVADVLPHYFTSGFTTVVRKQS